MFLLGISWPTKSRSYALGCNFVVIYQKSSKSGMLQSIYILFSLFSWLKKEKVAKKEGGKIEGAT
jgi:hypothetical protein